MVLSKINCSFVKNKNAGNPLKSRISGIFNMFFNDGDGGVRTHDLLNAIQALSQLSYTPKIFSLRLKYLYRYVNNCIIVSSGTQEHFMSGSCALC